MQIRQAESTKPSDKQLESWKNSLAFFNKNQLHQNSTEINEETKITKEVNVKESNKGGTKNKFKTSAEYSDQISNIKSIFKNCSLIKELTEKHEDEKVHQIVEQIEGIDLIRFLKAKEHSFFPKRILNVKKIIKTIEFWLQNLYCSVKDCPYNAIIAYECESTDQIYCQGHSDSKKHKGNQIVFQNELNECVLLLRELEKELLYVMGKIIIAKSENEGDRLYEIIIEDLENKFTVIKNTLNTMNGKVENLIEKPNTKKITDKNEIIRYRSLSFIKEDYEKCSEINNDILSIISKTSRKKKIELFIQALDNECKKLQLDEEFKSCAFLEVPDEIYEKEFNILNVPLQSKVLINNFEKKIKKSFKSIKINQKV